MTCRIHPDDSCVDEAVAMLVAAFPGAELIDEDVTPDVIPSDTCAFCGASHDRFHEDEFPGLCGDCYEAWMNPNAPAYYGERGAA